MALTAEDIQNVSFSIDRKGYDVDEVDVFLERVADEVDMMNRTIIDLEEQVEELQAAATAAAASSVSVEVTGEISEEDIAARSAQVAELERQLEELEAQLKEKAANDNAISQALIVAQRSADDIVSNARAEASNIVKDADEEADRIIGKAEADRVKIAESIRALENDRSDVRAEYREMLANFMADAQRKLAEIDGDSRRAALNAQSRAEAQSEYDISASASEFVPATAGSASATAPAAASGYVDKDFSGYGDADDDFVFDID